jgi:hypothetical protein
MKRRSAVNHLTMKMTKKMMITTMRRKNARKRKMKMMRTK